MPTYEYMCTKCGEQFEQFQSISEEPLAVCPKEKCGQKRWGKGKVKKQISAGAGLLFKGSGFYITDYRSENYKKGASKDAPATKSSGKEGKSSSGESKPTTSKTDSSSASTNSSSKSTSSAKSD